MFVESETLVGVEMKMLVVFLLAVLGCSPTEARIVSKCEVKDQLEKDAGNKTLMAKQNGTTRDNFFAKLVCYAELVSGFNTSAVKELIPRMEVHSGKQGGNLSTTRHPTRGRRNAREPPSPTRPTPFTHPPTEYTQVSSHSTPSTHPTPHPPTTSNQPPPATRPKRDRRSAQDDTEVRTLYGIFQLSNQLVCSNGTTPSPNICGIPCSSLVDNDIQNDVACVLKVSANPENKRIFEEGCKDVQASVYFAECSSS